MNFISAVIITNLLFTPAYADSSRTDGDLEVIGKNVAYGVKKLKLSFGHGFVIEEPPGIARGIKGKSASGDEVALFVRRGCVRFSARSDWIMKDFSKQTIIGVSRRTGNKRLNTGDVLWHCMTD